MELKTPEGYVLCEQGNVIVLRPAKKPELVMPDGMDLYYSPLSHTWYVTVVNPDKVQKKFDLVLEEGKTSLDPHVDLGDGEKISSIPKGFCIVIVKGEQIPYVQPVLNWNRQNGEIPAICYSGFYPVISGDEVRFVPSGQIERIIKETNR